MASLSPQINQTIVNNENNTKESAIVQLAKCDDIKKLSELVTADNANTPIDDSNNTLLHLATANKNLTLIKYLLEDFAKSDAERKQMLEKQNNVGETAFFSANELEITKYYLEKMRVDVLQTNDNGETILHHFEGEDEFERLKYILDTCIFTKDKCKQLLNHKDCLGNTPFLSSLAYDPFERSNHLEVIQYFVEKHNVNIFQTNNEQETILHLASRLFDEGDEIVIFLLNQCKNIEERKKLLEMRDEEGNTPFLWASFYGGSLDVIRTYIEQIQIEIGQFNNKGENILHRIANIDNSDHDSMEKAQECLNYFLFELPKTKEGINQLRKLLNTKNLAGNTPFLESVIKHNLGLVRLYINWNNVNLLQKNTKGQTALHLACISNKIDMVKYLIEEAVRSEAVKKDMLEATDVTDASPFIVAGVGGSTDVLRYFIETLKVDINQLSPKIAPVLVQCASHGHVQATQYLLSKGAVLPSSYATYANLACNQNIKYTAELLKLLYAADELVAYANGSVTTRHLSTILKEGASLNQRFYINETLTMPMYIAASKGNDKVVEEFLDVVVNLSIPAGNHFEAAKIAENNGHMSVVAKILMHALKFFLLNVANNKEFLAKFEKDTAKAIERIFSAVEKVKNVNSRSVLYLKIGRQFNELQLVEQAKRAFESIECYDPSKKCDDYSKEYREAQAELMALPIAHNSDSNILSLEEASDLIDVKTEKEEFGQKMLLLNSLKLGFTAGLIPTHAQEVSALRMRYLNDLFNVSLQASKLKAANAITNSYPDPCTADGLMFLTKQHYLTLEKNRLLREKNKKHEQEKQALQSEIDKLKAQNQTLETVLDRVLPSKKRKHTEEVSENDKEKIDTENEQEKGIKEETVTNGSVKKLKLNPASAAYSLSSTIHFTAKSASATVASPPIAKPSINSEKGSIKNKI